MSTKAPPLPCRNCAGGGAPSHCAHTRCRICPSSPATIALPKRDHRRHEAPPVGDLEGHPAVGGDASGLLDLLPCQPGRLLAQDGNPGGECSAGDVARGDPSGPPRGRRPAAGRRAGPRASRATDIPCRATPLWLPSVGSTTSVTRTADVRPPAGSSARRCMRPIRPAPTRASSTTPSVTADRMSGPTASATRSATRCRSRHGRDARIGCRRSGTRSCAV